MNKLNDEVPKSHSPLRVKSRLKRYFIRVSYLLVAVYMLIWIASPMIVRYFVGDFLNKEYQLILSEDTSIRYNPFLSHLTIKELTLSKQDKPVLQVKRSDIELHLHRLLIKQFYISVFSMEGFSVLTEKSSDLFEVAGFDLGANSDKDINQAPNNPDTAEEKTDFELVIPEIHLNDGIIKIELDDDAHLIKIEDFNIVEFIFSQTQKVLKSKLIANLNEAPVEFDMEVGINDGLGEIVSNLAIKQFDLVKLSKQLPQQIDELSGMVAFETSNRIVVSAESTKLTSPLTRLSVKDYTFKNASMQLNQEFLELSLKDIQVVLASNKSQQVNIKNILLTGGKLLADVDGFQVKNSGQQTNLDNLSLSMDFEKHAKAQMEEAQIKILSTEGEKNNLKFGNSEFLVALKNIDFEQNKRISIDKLVVDGLNGSLIINSNIENKKTRSQSALVEEKERATKDGVIKESLEVAAKNEIAVDQATAESSKPKLQVKINNTKLIRSKTLSFVDKSVTPIYERDIFIDEMLLGEINSELPNQKSLFTLKGRSDKYTKFNFDGFIKPFSDRVDLKMDGSITEVSLPPARSYINNILGFQLESGELDLSLGIEIVDSEISGSTLVKVRGLELAASENFEQNTIKEQTALPLNMALNMLKDNDGNVELDIPMLGNIDNPTFGMSSFVALITKKAIQSAAKSYLIKTFIPYAELLNVTISAGDFILKVRFEDLPYQPGQTEISEEQGVYLDQFISLMKSKPKTQVKVCAIATVEELALEGKELKTEEQNISLLEEIAKSRMEKFKEFVVNKEIESSRILLCSPKIDLKQKSIPRIVISV